MNQLQQIVNKLRESFWFLPALIVSFSMALALGLLEVDSYWSHQWMADWPRLFGADAPGARGMLATIAGSMLTVMGVTFSMTLMTLTLASSQYTSRILRNFMRDRVTQVVLGIFAGVFTYSLIVLRTIRSGDESEFIPSLSVAVSMVLAIGGIGALIYFIHHIAASIQASSIIASVSRETLIAVDRVFPEAGHRPDEREVLDPPPQLETVWQTVVVPKNGYIQNVNNDALIRFAREHQTLLKVECSIGEFVVEERPLVLLALADPLKKELITAIQSAFTIKRHRTVEQDIGFGIRQLVDMALRALSPSTNDTTTAVMCVDYLTAILSRVASRDLPAAHHYEKSTLRVIIRGPTFANLVAESFDQIRSNADGNEVVLLRLLDAVRTIAHFTNTNSASRRQILRDQVDCIAEVSARTIQAPHERIRLETRLAEVRTALKAGA